jgi:hypothetical protein
VGPSLCVSVAVKLAKDNCRDRDMLQHEAMVYDKFPCELQSTPPVVPKFFGYYAPSCDSADSYEGEDGDEEDASIVRRDVRKLLQDTISPILLLEPCGKPIDSSVLSRSNSRGFSRQYKKNGLANADAAVNRDTIVSMFERLHNARFIQGSTFERNILVQPGPLTLPRAERSLDNPLYRLIDFGRGECYDGDESQTADEKLKDVQQEVRSRIFSGGL